MDVQLQKIFDSNYKGKTLYNHFCELYYQMQENKYYKAQSLSDFEDLSNFIKENRFYHLPLKTADQVNNLQDQIFPWQEYCKQQMQLMQIKAKVINATVQNFLKLNALLNNVGYGFTDEDAYLIQQSLKSIAIRDSNIINIRFWGKLFAQNRDYYVIEVQLSKSYKEPQPIDCDEKLNEYVHYVTQDLLEDWALLPQVTRKQMEASRFITYVFSGNLNKEITQYPIFNGKEKHLLKAQILRITHANLLAPRGLYRFDDETKLITFEDEFKMPESAELSTMDGWVHLPPNILKQGRITFYEDPSLKEEELNQMKEADPELERLKSIKDDKPFEQNEGNWNIKIFGETQQYTNQEEQPLSYQIVQLRNYLWPGAITVSNSNDFISIYFGYGNKNQQNSFNPLAPNDIQEEPEDIDEIPEPNPREQPDELEPDSDDERRREQERREAELQQQQE
ncbi:unnamed protein product [Paramecium primaurelia]|uniref:Radial spoke head protein n=2 Tax=Paramecium TaxID=5884 RepID=A0A8S1STY3_9CILI|nr:unnamed protein product [Paramecium primaurelia]CAD8143400.1 unnamed protein product [Paramecium pentaurelia]